MIIIMNFNMGKKLRLFCAVLALSVLCGTLSATAKTYSDVYDYDAYAGAVDRLSNLDIINGHMDGSFRPGDQLTRSQFAKIVVCAMDKEDAANTAGTSSAFYDVPQGYWGAPYINYVSKNGIVIGYADGSFRPEQPITYAEALTVLVRMLGYSETDVGAFWPQNYMSKAKSLGITDNFASIGQNDAINRAQAAVIVDAVMFAEVNKTEEQQGAEDKTFLESVGYTVLKDMIVLSTSEEDSSMPQGSVRLSDNTTYTVKTSEPMKAAAYLGYAALDENNFVVAVKDNLSGAAAAEKMSEKGYTVLENCHIIASSAEDRDLSSSQIRTSAGVYTVQETEILSHVGEVGTLILNKDKKVISAGTHDAPKQEYIVSEVNTGNVEYVSENKAETLNLAEDFPIYVSYGTKKEFSKAKDDFVSGAELTLYRTNADGAWEFGVLDKNAGYSILNDCFIIATYAEDKTLASDQVRTSGGTYKVDSTAVLASSGTLGTAVVNSSNKIEQFANTGMAARSAVVNKITNNELEYTYSGGSKGTVKLDNTFVTYLDYEKSTYAQTRSALTNGTDITLYGSNEGNWEFLVIKSTSDVTPVVASKAYNDSSSSMEGISIDKNNLTVYRDGESAALSDIQRNDVVYYNTKTNTMDVYTKKVSGVYYEASPSKAYITSVTVGGKSYEIGTSAATMKLDASSGSYNIGDKITLLLGKNDVVVDVVQLSDFDYFDYGIVLDTYSRIAETGDNAGATEVIAKMFMPDGQTYEYVTKTEYNQFVGKLVKLTYDNGIVTMASVSTGGRIYGEIDKSKRTINGKTVLKDAKIIQIISEDGADTAEAELIDFDTLSVTEFTSGQVINTVTANKFGDIGIMVVRSVSKESYDYPMLISRSGSAGSSTYKFYMNGMETSYPSPRSYGMTVGQPVGLRIVNGQITDMFSMYKYKSANSIDAVDGGRIMLGGTVYDLAPNVKVYTVKNINDYSEISIDELEKLSVNSVTVYSDLPYNRGGLVRAIVVSKK